MTLTRALADVNNDIDEARRTNQDWESVIRPLYDEQKAIIKHNRNEWEDKNQSIQIDCPEHITHKATLFTHGHRYAGVWECPITGDTDSCPHFDFQIEEIEDDYDHAHKSHIYVCVSCKKALEGDPDGDQA